MLSTKVEPAVALYPDSDKIGVWPGREEDTVSTTLGSATSDIVVHVGDQLSVRQPARRRA